MQLGGSALPAPAMLWSGNTISAREMADTLARLDSYKSVYINCIANSLRLEA